MGVGAVTLLPDHYLTDEEVADRAAKLVLHDLALITSTHASVAEAVRLQVLADLHSRNFR